jgi:hypothetical protein
MIRIEIAPKVRLPPPRNLEHIRMNWNDHLSQPASNTSTESSTNSR